MSGIRQPDSRKGEPLALRAVALLAALVMIALPVGHFARQHLASPNLWFDESGQYWLSQGLHHASAPHSPAQGWSRIVEYSRVFNSDPGGFTLLLREWTGVFGTAPLALRSLPFIFLLATLAVIFLSARRMGANSLVAVIAASIPLGFPMLLNYSTEIRAYSMETCAVAFFFFVSGWLFEESRPRRIIALGCIGAFFLTSRYSSYLFGAAACATALLPLRPTRAAVVRFLCFSIPCLLAVAAGYLIFARLQAGGTQRAPAYVEDFILQGKTHAQVLARLRENLFSREALPFTIYLVTAPVFAWFGPRALANLRAVVGRTALFCLLAILLTAAASWGGKLPWGIYTRWSIGCHALSACCLAMDVIVVGSCLSLWTAGWRSKALSIAVAAGFGATWLIVMNRAVHGDRPYYETIASHFETLANAPHPKELRFFVPPNASPTVRYLCEVGPFKNAFSYPGNFHFETGPETTAAAPIAASDYDFVILTHFSLAESYQRRIRGGTSELRSTPQPSCLLLLKN